ncbi:MAG: biopolymer transporter ExbD [Opitutae bacterium]|nr:biopolymer transporter ExbD [Opitutae bacterium]
MLMRSRLALLLPRRARVEIIPLIDVVFFLLAAFVLFTLSLNRTQSLPVTLPVPGEKSDQEIVTIQVTEGGAVYWNKELAELSEVPGRLAHYMKQTDDPRVVVTGDERAKFGPMVAVIDNVRKVGIKTYSVETRTRPTGR